MTITIESFLDYCDNKAVKALVLKLLKRGDTLQVHTNESTYIKGQYVVSHGSYTVTKIN